MQIPGGGVGLYDGCSAQYAVGYSNFNFGMRYGGIRTRAGCAFLPVALQPGCQWRFEWYSNGFPRARGTLAQIQYAEITCPSELTDVSTCTI